MTLRELSALYLQAAQPIRERLHQIRLLEKAASDPEERLCLHRRRQVLSEILTELNDLAELTAHYYERGYYRNEKYRL